MEANAFTKTMMVQDADTDFRSMLKPSALLRYVEQISSDHARSLGMDDRFFKEHQVAFLVGKQAVKVFRMPQREEEILLSTATEQSNKGAVKRITKISDKTGRMLAMVDCRWILVDLTTGHIMRQPSWKVDSFWNESIPDELPLQVHKTKDTASVGRWRASYSLCDMNGHINNARYLDIACDALPEDVVRAAPLSFASIKYHREVQMGRDMEILYAPSNSGWYISGKCDDHTAFECYLEFGQH